MKKGLFVLFDGISSTIFESQVLTHINDMRKSNILLDVLAFDSYNYQSWVSSNNNKKIFSKKTESKITLKKCFNIYIPFSFFINALLFVFFIIKNSKNYDYLHARADYTAFILLITKPIHRKPVVWDCRGDSLDELKFALDKKNFLIKRVLGLYLINLQKIILYIVRRFSDSNIFVSESLFSLHKKHIKTKNNKIIPCLVDNQLFYFSESLRSKARNDLGILSNENLFIYSGSMVAYQSVNEQIIIYKEILKNPHNKIIILTSMTEEAERLLSKISNERLLITSACFSEMNYFYNASDFSFLIRNNNQLNFVASPTKFGEYCLCGLLVIMNDTVEQASSISLNIGNHVSVNNLAATGKIDNHQRAIISNKAKTFFSRDSIRFKYIELYSSLIVKNYSTDKNGYL